MRFNCALELKVNHTRSRYPDFVGDLDHTGRAELRRRFFPAMARAKWPEQVALFAVSAVVLQRHRKECDRRG